MTDGRDDRGLVAIAGLFHLTGTVHTVNPWLIELSIAGFAVVSVPVTWHVYRHWLARATSAVSA